MPSERIPRLPSRRIRTVVSPGGGVVRNAVTLAAARGYRSIAFPLIGAGTGGKRREDVRAWMRSELEGLDFPGEIRIVELPESG